MRRKRRQLMISTFLCTAVTAAFVFAEKDSGWQMLERLIWPAVWISASWDAYNRPVTINIRGVGAVLLAGAVFVALFALSGWVLSALFPDKSPDAVKLRVRNGYIGLWVLWLAFLSYLWNRPSPATEQHKPVEQLS